MILTNNNIVTFLKYGQMPPQDIPKFKKTTRLNLDLSEYKTQCKQIIDDSVTNSIKYPNESIFLLSGGLDSTLNVSYFPGITAFGISSGINQSEDNYFSHLAAEYYSCNYIHVDKYQFCNELNIEQSLIDMNTAFSYPNADIDNICFNYIISRLKDKCKYIIGGDGSEPLVLNRATSLLYYAIKNKLYDYSLALSYFNNRALINKCKFKNEWNIHKLINSTTDLEYIVHNVINTPMFNRTELTTLGLVDYNIHIDDNLDGVVDYLFNNHEYSRSVIKINDLCKYYNVNYISPYLSDPFIYFILSLPYEIRNCLGYRKYIIYESIHDRIPNEILYRRHNRMFPNEYGWVNLKWLDIIELAQKCLLDKTTRLYSYINYDFVLKLLQGANYENFNYSYIIKLWRLLNLYFWIEIHRNEV